MRKELTLLFEFGSWVWVLFSVSDLFLRVAFCFRCCRRVLFSLHRWGVHMHVNGCVCVCAREVFQCACARWHFRHANTAL